MYIEIKQFPKAVKELNNNGEEVKCSPRMQEIEIRSPVATDLLVTGPQR